jgi:hypothetical protein
MIVRTLVSVGMTATAGTAATTCRNGINSTREGRQEQWGHQHQRGLPTVTGASSTRGLQFKKRCRLSWLTLVFEPKCGGRGRIAGSQPISTAVHKSPNKLWRSNSIFNLCHQKLNANMKRTPTTVTATSGMPATVRNQRQLSAASYSSDASNKGPEM